MYSGAARRIGASVQTTDLEMRYQVGSNTIRAVDGVDLTVPAGQFVIVLGRSGCGKSTLLHLMAGLQRPSGGRVAIGDTEIQSLGTDEVDVFRRRNIGLIFQLFNLIPSLDVETNIALPLIMEGHRVRELRARVGQLAETLGIQDRLDHGVSELSGGEMQRVAIARALIVEPRVILADEPTGNVDLRAAHEIFLRLRELCDGHGVTVVTMTHDVGMVGYGDRVIEMSDGKITSDSGIAQSATDDEY